MNETNDFMQEREFQNEKAQEFTSHESENDQSLKIPVIHEQVQIGKKLVETGKVRITKTVSEHQELVDIPLVHEEVNVNRVSINRYIDSETPQSVRYEGETMIIPVIKEVLVVEKRLMLVEEIHVTRSQVETHHQEPVTLLKEEVHIERTAAQRNPDA